MKWERKKLSHNGGFYYVSGKWTIYVTTNTFPYPCRQSFFVWKGNKPDGTWFDSLKEAKESVKKRHERESIQSAL